MVRLIIELDRSQSDGTLLQEIMDAFNTRHVQPVTMITTPGTLLAPLGTELQATSHGAYRRDYLRFEIDGATILTSAQRALLHRYHHIVRIDLYESLSLQLDVTQDEDSEPITGEHEAILIA